MFSTGGDYTLAGGFWPGVEEFCFGDLGGDGQIGSSDLAQLLGNYGTTMTVYADGDVDLTDLTDLATLLANYGTTCP